jgi:hypothetical protein
MGSITGKSFSAYSAEDFLFGKRNFKRAWFLFPNKKSFLQKQKGFTGRGGRIRTCGLLLPKQAR